MEFRRDIQGLRALAVTLVILDHLDVPGFEGGFIGVDVFFVISGFLITSLMLAEYEETNTISLPQFYLRRLKRIVPASVVTTIAVVLGSRYLLTTGRASAILEESYWALGFGANIKLIRDGADYFSQSGGVSPFQHFWSLAVEEQFYLVWPSLLLLVANLHGLGFWRFWIRKNQRILVVVFLATALSFAASMLHTDRYPLGAYFSTFTRLWELGIGVALAVLAPHLRRIPMSVRTALAAAGLIAIVTAATVVVKPTTPFPGWAALVPTLGALAIVLAGIGDQRSMPHRLLGASGPGFIGTISYSLYLWHWPIIVFDDALYPGSLEEIQHKLLLLAIILSTSIASYYLVENTFRHLGSGRHDKHWHYDASGTRLAGAILVAAVIAGAVFIIPDKGSESVEDLATVIAPPTPPTTEETTSATSTTPPNRPVVSTTPIDAGPSDAGPSAVLTAWNEKLRTAAADGEPSDALLDTIDGMDPKDLRLCDQSPGLVRCSFGDPAAPRSVVLFGDSHAAMWAEVVAAAFAGPEWRVDVVYKAGCGLAAIDFENPFQNARGGSELQECIEWRQQALASVVIGQYDFVLLADHSFWVQESGSANDWVAGLASTLALIERSAQQSRVVLLDEVTQSEPIVFCVTRRTSPDECGRRRGLTSEIRKLKEQAASRTDRVEFVRTADWLCVERDCLAAIDDIPVYVDGNHFYIDFRPKLGPLLSDALGVG